MSDDEVYGPSAPRPEGECESLLPEGTPRHSALYDRFACKPGRIHLGSGQRCAEAHDSAYGLTMPTDTERLDFLITERLSVNYIPPDEPDEEAGNDYGYYLSRWPGMYPPMFASPREAIDAAITAARKGAV